MTVSEILDAYRGGRLSTAELKEHLQALQDTVFPLSEGQRGLWALHKLAPLASAYNLPLAFAVSRELDLGVLRLAVDAMARLHPMLRAVIEEDDGEPRQRVQALAQIPFLPEDVAARDEASLHAYIDTLAKTPFDFARGPLLRVHLLSRSATSHVLLIVVHHIVFDGSSIAPLLSTLWQSYETFLVGGTLAAATPQAGYADFVDWERRMLDGADARMHRDYWLAQLAGQLPALELPSDRPRMLHHRSEASTHALHFPADLVARVRAACAVHDVGPVTWFLAIFKLLLSRYTGQTDILVGMPTAGRPQERFEGLVGFFVNMIALRSQIVPTQTFDAFVRELQLTLADGLDHAVYPFPRVVRDLRTSREGRSAPVFQLAYEFQNANSLSPRHLRDRVGAPDAMPGVRQEGEYELVFEVVETEAGFDLRFKFDTNLFEAATIERLAARYLHLAAQALHDPATFLGDFVLMDAVERQRTLVEWNATQAAYPSGRALHELVAEQAARTPDAPAVADADAELCYRQLAARIERIAAYLHERGVVANDRVGICLERSIDLVASLLGILQAGASYVPLDPDFPPDRLRHMLADCGATRVLSQASLAPRISALLPAGAELILLDSDSARLATAPPAPPLAPAELAYVIYTSGSTGQPKGVMVGQRALTNFLCSMREEPGLVSGERLLAVTTYSFDIAALELFLPLIVGGTVQVCAADVARDARRLREEIARVRPTLMQATPTTWAMLLAAGWRNEEGVRVLCGGEAMPTKLRQTLVANGWQAWNLYGPTETTIWSTVQRLLDAVPQCIGRPIANTQIYILDANAQPLPADLPGELCIGGDGLAHGYWHQPALTAERFFDHGGVGQRIYRTGDLARWRADGTLEYLGRIDAQVKLRGFRIEPGEIEARLCSHPAVAEAAVVMIDQDGHSQLLAYVVPKAGAIDSRALREHVRGSLPDYMTPARYRTLDALPQTPNGKIDRKRLVTLDVTDHDVADAALSGLQDPAPIETALRAIWVRALRHADIKLDDGFFDVGGDSVLAVTVADRIERHFGHPFQATELFRHASIRRIARHLTAALPRTANSLPAPTTAVAAQSAEVIPDDYAASLAIIGIACRLPGAADHRQFWENLHDGRDTFDFLERTTLLDNGVPPNVAADARYVPVRSAIDDRDRFDSAFFRITPRDAQLMDPQARLLLQHAWQAVEDAGYVCRDIPDTGVFIACAANGYQSLAAASAGTSSVLGSSEQYVAWLMSQSGSVPTLISHRLGLKGPSFAVHSNCSSSLIALHCAQLSLAAGEARHALVGAASVMPAPSLGYLYQKGLNFSSDGRVKAFDAAADGMVGGEGVAVLLLKRARDAIVDGDHVYALIRGIAVNNDGADKAGFYAPSPEGQAQVIERALRMTGVAPDSIAYVEAHGTGTELGDPIELAALAEAYARYTSQRQFCGIGSVKTNIGHLDTAAGLAGCIKVALALAHGRLPPSLHYHSPNPKFDFASSPFYVLDRALDWPLPTEPRRAALSSFGIGGTNAHAIFESVDATRHAPERPAVAGPQLVPLSARDGERLREYARRMAQFLETESATPLAELAYTLQVGREAMAARVVFLVEDIADLAAKLSAFAVGGVAIDGCIVGDEPGAAESVLDAEDLQALTERWIAERKLARLAQVWVQGVAVDWSRLHASKPRRLSAPTYPFAGERFSLVVPSESAPTAVASIARLHPLLHRNTSTLAEQCFSSRFDGSEFFLRDHVIHERRVMPGVAYLEMVRAAVHASAAPADTAVLHLRNVVWPRPLTVGEAAVDVHVRIAPETGGEISFSIYSHDPVAPNELRVHSQGRAIYRVAVEVPVLDLDDLRKVCHERVDGETSYAVLPSMGFRFGPSFRAVTALNFGPDARGRPQILAEIALPKVIAETAAAFVLHPSLLDAAVGAVPSDDTRKPTLPFVLHELICYAAPGRRMFAWVRFAGDSRPGDAVQNFDIDLADEGGRVCVAIRRYSRRVLEGEVGQSANASLLLAPRWHLDAASAAAEAAVRHVVLVASATAAATIEPALRAAFDGVSLKTLDAGGNYTDIALGVFAVIREVLMARPASTQRVQVVVVGTAAWVGALGGLLKSVRLESRWLAAQVFQVDAAGAPEDLIAHLRGASPGDVVLRCDGGKRQVEVLREIDSAEPVLPWKDDAVYLISGGAGGLGRLFAAEIARHATGVRLIVAGRSAPSAEVLAAMGGHGIAVESREMDVADAAAVSIVVDEIVARYGRLDGVIHAAGVIRDNYAVRKSDADFGAVLAPKVAGLMHLDEATRALPLDFFFAFSSVVGAFGNGGQADYAAANAFMDGYLHQRHARVAAGERQGRSLSIGWPLWRHGGMRIDAASEALMRQSSGMTPMPDAAGFDALYRAYASAESHVVVAYGQLVRLREKLLGALPAASVPARAQPEATALATTTDSGELAARVLGMLTQGVVDVIKARPEQVSPDVELSTLGFDSISLTEFSNRLNQDHNLDLTPTIFFEFPTLRGLAAHLLQAHGARWRELFGTATRSASAAPTGDAGSGSDIVVAAPVQRFVVPAASVARPPGGADTAPIAVIGMSARFPMAADTAQFWDNLRLGRDCISEIPADRWDWRVLYGDPLKDANKTNVKWGGFIDGVGDFDPLFFGISPREAELMDPQQRLLLTHAWLALEDAGYSARSISGSRTAVFVGMSDSGYADLVARSNVPLEGASATAGVPSMAPNRVSYFLNLHGPSEPIETACSSSLVAIHRALHTLCSGDCDLVLVGGVHTILTPWAHVSFSKAGMLSEDGRCKTFSSDANGYVRGEGIGLLVLKRLDDAERDRDAIYGLVRASAENHGGRANSLTAPNPKAQADLLREVYGRAGIDPRSITYIETHGTGTPLGDPIEINALKSAFRDLYGEGEVEAGRCVLGSVKSNIGHLEFAAGVASVIKVLLQLRHATIAPSLHCAEINPYIQLDGSPFRIARELEPWRVLTDADGRALPRRAGVSSFGFGGVNAHIVIEEYCAPAAAVASAATLLFVLSARSEAQVREQAVRLLAALDTQAGAQLALGDIAYTLQVGREPMNHRAAFTAATPAALREALTALADGAAAASIWRSTVRRGESSLALFSSDDELKEALAKWIARGKLERVAEAWANGLEIDWALLHADSLPRRVHLPGYPFELQRCWVPQTATVAPALPGVRRLHPLLHENISDFDGERFRASFHGEEFFLRDHVVGGRRLLPGVAQLEMAIAAGRLALGQDYSGARLGLNHTMFARPLVHEGGRLDVQIAIDVDAAGEMRFALSTATATATATAGGRVVHAQGGLRLADEAEAPTLDLAGLQAGCTGTRLDSAQCYAFCEAVGFEYGPAHRALVDVVRGTIDALPYTLARLSLPAAQVAGADAYLLHPSLLDGALQAAIVSPFGESADACDASMPFALEQLDVFCACPHEAYVWLREAPGSSARLRKLDLDICDAEGRVCVQLRGYATRAADAAGGAVHEIVLLESVLKLEPATVTALVPDQHWVLSCCVGVAPVDGVHWVEIALTADDPAARLRMAYREVAAQVRTRLAAMPAGTLLIQLLVAAEGDDGLLGALAGLLRSAALEQPRLIGQTLLLDAAARAEASRIVHENRVAAGATIHYRDGERHVVHTVTLAPLQAAPVLPWKEGGVYLISGGNGGLGRLFAREIASQINAATIVLAGRSASPTDDFAAIAKAGIQLDYLSLDVSDADAVRAALAGIVARHGRLDGILHAAGVLRDAFLLRQDPEAADSVLAVKASGLVCLDQASADLALDFFVAFSSVVGSYGSIGQADYATANAFLDTYLTRRAQHVAAGKRHGRSLSIGWPLWAEGGMRVDAATQQRLSEAGSVSPLSTAQGLRAFYAALACGAAHVVVWQPPVAPASLLGSATATAKPVAAAPPTVVAAALGDIDLRDRTVTYFRKLLAASLKLAPERIEPDAPFEKYGIDSIMIMQMITELEKVFGTLSKTLFFEHPNLESLAAGFVTMHRERLLGLLSPAQVANKPAAARAVTAAPSVAAGLPLPRRSRVVPGLRASTASPLDTPLDIAIIGLSGRYPQARDVECLWDNLKQGVDAITEIPASRWDYHRYFDPDKGSFGKSYSKWGGFIDGVDEFDPLFFSISPLEAQIMDPQERLFLQCVYSTLEDAGYTRDNLTAQPDVGAARAVGVFVGVMYEEYQLYAAQAQILGQPFALGGHPASIANRVSYFCNFNGPSIALDTMCSSSLTCIHLACQSIIHGGCELAIAGGVNVSVHPNKYLALSQGRFASSTGRCESFGAGGDGYVPGEGVGAVLLKPLAQALLDGDQVYGVIKGSSLNHGGKTNGYTVPNPAAHSQVIAAALRQSRVPARAISYIEAHGTGTSLGDPIEIAGLNRAFAEQTADFNFCAIGSAKSNIGHCESAAGIAGLTKVLLQFKYRTLVPSLHSSTLNPHIDFEHSPFVVQRTLGEWRRPTLDIDGALREYPRVAGLSSFGAGGANAHLVIEELLAAPAAEAGDGEPAVIVLSARNAARLADRVAQLTEYVTAHFDEFVLADIAYTLQVGREPMDQRLGFVVHSKTQLRDTLVRLAAGEDADDVFRGDAKRNKDALALFVGDEDLRTAVDAWIAKGKYAKLLDGWVRGIAFDWQRLYGETRPRRVSLPTYPFAREPYWLPFPSPLTARIGAASLHPLLGANVSDARGLRFATRFDGSEFFLADHVVLGRPTLPGVAYLEMARAAVQRVACVGARAGDAIVLSDLVWMSPWAFEAGTMTGLVIVLEFDGTDRLSFEVRSAADADAEQVHCRGRARLVDAAVAPQIDLAELRRTIAAPGTPREENYRLAASAGIDYGPGHRALQEAWIGQGDMLARLMLPAPLDGSRDAYVLHPSLLDASLQVSVGLLSARVTSAATQAMLPFGLDRIEIFDRTPSEVWAWLRAAKTAPGAGLPKLDIDLADADGKICVRLSGMSFRAALPAQTGAASAPFLVGLQQLAPTWETLPPATLFDAEERAAVSAAPTLVVGATSEQFDALRAYFSNAQVLSVADAEVETLQTRVAAVEGLAHIVWIANPPADVSGAATIAAQNDGVLACFRLLKALLATGYANRALAWTVLTEQAISVRVGERPRAAHASLHGLFGSVAKEYGKWAVRVVDVGMGQWPWADIMRLPANPQGDALAFRDGEWCREQLLAVEDELLGRDAYREDGVYVVIGGAGGIGEAWSEWVIRHYRARIAWIGRREEDAAITAQLDRLATLGPRPIYVSADATDRDQMAAARRDIVRRFGGAIHGVLHSAIVLDDKSLANMHEDRFMASLRAKVDVAVRIGETFAADNLDFVLFFSSFQSFTKAPGQSNYAAGCTFKDAYARELAHALDCPVKVVNWGYWGSLGIVASEAYRQRMERFGLASIEPEEGMLALQRLLRGTFDQLAVIKTTRADVLAGLCPRERVTLYAAEVPALAQEVGDIAKLRAEARAQSLQDAPPAAASAQTPLAFEAMQNALVDLLWLQLRSLGLFAESPASVRALRRGVHEQYARWLGECLRLLETRGYLLRDADGDYRVLRDGDGDAGAVWNTWGVCRDVCLAETGLRAQVRIVDATLHALPEILTGKRLATDILFSQSSVDQVEGVYKENVGADYYNSVLADALLAYVDARRRAAADDTPLGLRILEIGAGTGGTSALLFRRLQDLHPQIAEYCYTDISRAFLMHAQDHYGAANPFLTYKLFNVEEAPGPQGIEAGAYDIVVATNVLHATKNIRRTLRNTKAVLRRNGLLLVNEVNDNGGLLALMSFGLLKGWWLYEDDALRIPGCPALAPREWQRVLSDEGFDAVHFPAVAAHPLGQQIIVAQSDGQIRQPVADAERDGVRERRRARVLEGVSERTATPVSPVAVSTPLVSTAVPDEQRLEAFVKSTIVAKLSEALRVNPAIVDNDDSFADYGVDSITGVNLVDTLNKALHVELATTSLFEFSSVNQLARHLLSHYRDALAALFGPSATTAAPVALTPLVPAVPAPIAPVPAAVFSAPVRGTLPAPVASVPTSIERQPPIAVIGMSGRFAGSDTLDVLWGNLAEGAELIGEVTRWNLDQFLPGMLEVAEPADAGKAYCRRAGFLAEIDRFDALFFKISGSEATHMDPQQRLFLEECWSALEDAGYVADAVKGRQCGVYVGCARGDYHEIFGARSPAQSFWGNSGSVIPARIAYYLDLKGPAIAIDTACSSSLVAIHSACQGLWCHETELALAGGVHIQVTPSFFVSASKGGMLSPTGRCYAFDARADGFVPGEGAGAIVLKRLADAVRDNDHIHGVIVASGLNQDGTTNGITAPNAASQEQLIADTYERFDIDPAQIQMIEAHGTGTKLGDPIEFSALTRAFRRRTAAQVYCAIGSVKTNLGHTASASGVASVLKILLALRHRQIPASLNYREGNPHIEFAGSPFFVNTRLRAWDVGVDAQGRSLPRRAAASSFGFSGTNAHIVIEEAPRNMRVSPRREAELIVLSARSAEQLRQQVERLLEHLAAHPQLRLGDLAYTLLVGRKHMNCRLACIAPDGATLAVRLQAWLRDGHAQGVALSAGEDDDRLQQTAQHEYGDQCIEVCRQSAGAEYPAQLAAIADLYVQRYALNFPRLFEASAYSRLALPTYPFARKRYWVEAPSAMSLAVARLPEAVERVASNDTPMKVGDAFNSYLMPVWEPLPARAFEAQATWPRAHQSVLVVAPEAAFAAEGLGQQLLQRHAGACRIALGAAVDAASFAQELAALPRIEHIYWIGAAPGTVSAEDTVAAQNRGVLALFALVKALLGADYATGVLGWTLVTFGCQAVAAADEVFADDASLHGLAASMAKEYRQWAVRLVDLEAAVPAPLDVVLCVPADPLGNALCRRRGEWYRQQLVPFEAAAPRPAAQYRHGGLYVVIGGAGGIGVAWTASMIARYQARVVWLGRRPADAAIAAQIERLGRSGPAPSYRCVDATDAAALRQACTDIRAEHAGARINGVVHSAIVLDDASLAGMSVERFTASLRAKVDTSVALANAFAAEELDFVLFFSSIQSFVKAPGQSNYAAGCTFMDAYARQLGRRWSCAVKVMNWGYWGSLGVVASEEYRQRMDRLGLASIEVEQGMRALDVLLDAPVDQLVYLRATRADVLQDMSVREAIVAYPVAVESMLERVRHRLRKP